MTASPGDVLLRPLAVKPSRHPLRIASAVLLASLIVLACLGVKRSGVIDFGEVPTYLFDSAILYGLRMTVLMTATSLVLGLVAGLVFALLRLSKNPVARAVSAGYVWVFLGTPAIVQLIFWYNIGVVIPTLTIGIPGVFELYSGTTNALLTPFVAAVIALGLHEGAYYAEIIRSGIISVDQGQRAAAQSLGMRSSTIMRRVVLPQAFRVMIPPGMGRVIALLKDTSLVTVIAGGEMMTEVVAIYSENFLILELLLVASIWYLVAVSLLMVAQRHVERWANRYEHRTTASTDRSHTPIPAEQ